MMSVANKLLKQLNADFDSTAEMGTLSVAQQQMVEIAKALFSALTPGKIFVMPFNSRTYSDTAFSPPFLDLFGEKVDFKGPKDAQEAGIAAVYQHPTSYPHLTVAENIFMGHT